MIDLRCGDCLDEMPKLAAAAVDAVIADIPYGTTACAWDTVIPFEPMWAQLKRIAKPRAAIVLFGSQPFTSALVMSNPKWFRYEWVWKRTRKSGFYDANRKPLKGHESLSVFSANGHIYNPQFEEGKPYIHHGRQSAGHYGRIAINAPTINRGRRFPQTVIDIPSEPTVNSVHPTQKPVTLMEYLIRTYTNEGDTVLDFTMGSGTTLVACVRTGRNGIGIENDPHYFAIAEKRIAEAQMQMVLM